MPSRLTFRGPAAFTAAAAALALLAVAFAPATARADVLLSNLELPTGNAQSGINTQFVKAVGITISGSTSYDFTSLEAAIRNQTQTAYTATATLRASDGTNPGALLTTFSSVALPAGGTGAPYINYTFTGSYLLLAGQSYWFVLETDRPATGAAVAWGAPASSAEPTPAAGITYDGYRQGAVGAGGVIAWTNSTTPNSVRINATVAAVPEPGTLALLALGGGLALAGGVVKRRKG